MRVTECGGHVAHRLQLPADVGLQAERGAVQEAALQGRRQAAEGRGGGSGPLSHPPRGAPSCGPPGPPHPVPHTLDIVGGSLGRVADVEVQEDPGLEGEGGPRPRLGGQHGLLLAHGAPLRGQQELSEQEPGGVEWQLGRFRLPGAGWAEGSPPPLTSAGPGGPPPAHGSRGAAGPRSPATQHSCCRRCPAPPAGRSPWRSPWSPGPLRGRGQRRPA